MINDRPLDHQDDQGLYAKMIMYDNQVQEALMIKAAPAVCPLGTWAGVDGAICQDDQGQVS